MGKNYRRLLNGTLLSAFLAICITATANSSQQTQLLTNDIPSATDDQAWHFLFAPYLWASGLSGNMSIANRTVDISESFKDILDDLDFGAEAHIEANRGLWTFMVDPTYLKLSDNFTVSTLNNEITQKLWLVDTGIFARILDLSSSEQSTTVELLGGGRYMQLDASLDIDSLASFSNNENSFSPIVGMRIKHWFSSRTQVWIRGDYGGFHVDGMDETWSANAGLSYAVSKHVEIGAAYKVLKLDFTDNANHFSMNTLMYGPMIGIGFFN